MNISKTPLQNETVMFSQSSFCTYVNIWPVWKHSSGAPTSVDLSVLFTQVPWQGDPGGGAELPEGGAGDGLGAHQAPPAGRQEAGPGQRREPHQVRHLHHQPQQGPLRQGRWVNLHVTQVDTRPGLHRSLSEPPARATPFIIPFTSNCLDWLRVATLKQ